MRDLILFLTVVAILPLCVYRPWVGVLAWSWLGYMNPHRLTWGFAYDFPFAQVVAIATLAGFVWYVIKRRGRFGFFAGAELKILALLWLIFSFTTAVALSVDDARIAWEQVTKIILMAFLTAYLIDEERKLRYLLMVIAVSIGFYGVKGGIFSILTAGQYRVWGPAGSFIEDNNALALALNMALPFMYYLGKTEKRTWLKNGLFAMFGLSVLAILFTYSRGGFLGLLVVFVCIFLTIRLRWKVLIAMLAVISFPIVMSQLPDTWVDRMLTMKTYEQDGSALSRLEAWKAAWNLAVDRPLTGGGFGTLNDRDTFIRYNPGIVAKMQEQGETGIHASGVHSVYFELLAENGFPGLIVFLTLCLATLITTRRLAKSRRGPEPETHAAYGQMLFASLLAYLASGTFLEMASFDFFYEIVVLSIVSRRLYLDTPIDARVPAAFAEARKIAEA